MGRLSVAVCVLVVTAFQPSPLLGPYWRSGRFGFGERQIFFEQHFRPIAIEVQDLELPAPRGNQGGIRFDRTSRLRPGMSMLPNCAFTCGRASECEPWLVKCVVGQLFLTQSSDPRAAAATVGRS